MKTSKTEMFFLFWVMWASRICIQNCLFVLFGSDYIANTQEKPKNVQKIRFFECFVLFSACFGEENKNDKKHIQNISWRKRKQKRQKNAKIKKWRLMLRRFLEIRFLKIKKSGFSQVCFWIKNFGLTVIFFVFFLENFVAHAWWENSKKSNSQ